MARAVIALLLLPVCFAAQQKESNMLEIRKNPIRKVVNMMRNMQKKIEDEGKKSEELFEKFMCYCKTSGEELGKTVSDAEAKVPQLESSVEEGQSKKKQLDDDITQHKADREAANEAMKKATGIREKEAAQFAADTAEAKSNIASTSKAVEALEKGMGGAFLQSKEAKTLQNYVQSSEAMEDADRESLTSFLSTGDADSESGPGTGEIVGILKTMNEEMNKDLADSQAAEKEAIASYEGLISAKTKEVKSLGKAIEDKVSRTGDLAVQIVQMQGDLSDTEDSLAADQKALANLQRTCKKKTDENDELNKARSDELLALSDTIKILNDDDALDLFKKTLPSAAASFLQVQETEKAAKADALATVHEAQQTSKGEKVHLDFLALALHGKTAGFGKVNKMIDDMIASMKKEQEDDDEKKEFCAKKLDAADDKKKTVERDISDLETVISDAEDGIAGLQEEVKALKASIADLDKSVASATEQRKEENADFQETMQGNGAAKEILGFAKNRLQKFYNPKLAKAALADVSAHNQAPAAPVSFLQYKKEQEAGTGIVAMIDTLIRDLEKEMAQAKFEEKDSQEDYEQMLADSKAKREGDSKKLANKQKTLADLKSQLEATTEEKKKSSKELMGLGEYISGLHGDCDWLMQNFDTRKEARESEIDALTKSKAVLNGADLSLVQTGSSRKFLKRA